MNALKGQFLLFIINFIVLVSSFSINRYQLWFLEHINEIYVKWIMDFRRACMESFWMQWNTFGARICHIQSSPSREQYSHGIVSERSWILANHGYHTTPSKSNSSVQHEKFLFYVVSHYDVHFVDGIFLLSSEHSARIWHVFVHFSIKSNLIGRYFDQHLASTNHFQNDWSVRTIRWIE